MDGFKGHNKNEISADSNTTDINTDYSAYAISNKTTYYVNFHTGSNGVIDAVDIHVYSQND